jgi:NitT/TauT family transport system substrate-binding protein
LAWQHAAGGQSLIPLNIGSGLDDGATPALYGVHAGIFRRYGLDVNLHIGSSGTAIAAAVNGGSLDIAKTNVLSLITAYSHGLYFKIVAGSAIFSAAAPTDEICVLKDSPITNVAALSGKIVAVAGLGELGQIGLEALVDEHGGNSSTIRFIELPFGAMLGALEAGRADAISVGNPIMQTVVSSGKVRTFGDPYEGIGTRFHIATWFATVDWCAKNPVAVERFAQAIRESATYTNAHHAETAPLIAAAANIDVAFAQKMNRLTTITTVDPSELQLAIDAAAKYGAIPKRFDAQELLFSRAGA